MRIAIVGVWLLLTGCAAQSALVTGAQRGELASLRPALEARLRAGTLGRREAREIARVTLERELAQARGEEALRRVLESESCVHDAAKALRARSHGKDAAAAEALVVLYEAGEISRGTALDHADDPDSAFRRVAVRALDQPGDHERRIGFFTHSDGALRIMALRAAMVAGDSREIEALRERARLDPEPDARSNAIRALALLDDPPDDLAAFLGDLARTADDATQGDIAVAWALSPVFEKGGREALVGLLSSDKTKPEQRAQAALLVLRTRPETGLGALGESVLLQILAGDAQAARLLVLRSAPARPKVLEAVRTIVKQEGKTELGIAAAEAQLRAGALVPAAEREAAKARLFTIAGTDGGLGSHARAALARQGDRRVQAWLERDLQARDPVRKLMAARSLAALEAAGRAAPLLADAEPSVRTRAACVLLAAPR